MSDGIGDIPSPEFEPDWESDFLSTQEAEHWDDLDDLSKQKKTNELYVHKTLGCLFPAGIAIAFILFLIVLGVYVSHLLLPAAYRWLEPDELVHIHNMLFSGVVGGAIAIVARMYLIKD